ncbi:MAG TPA: carbamoyltransferase C-terminal domain-containing protein, partial [Polyangiaceae bacterium]
VEDAAKLLAGGSVIGWVQGRSEYGPRALGSRSILADPRPAENKEIINAMVKKREGFRPFAPAVLTERASEFFVVPPAKADLGHMTYVLGVREDKRALLGAITHVDGSARVQTVERDVNPRYWGVIEAFGTLTGVPVLLNTSFNNNAEPIVETVDDAVVCFLTTKLNHLVVGDFVIDKREITFERCRSLIPALCPHVSLERVKGTGDDGRVHEFLRLANSDNLKTEPLSREVWKLLDAADGAETLDALVTRLEVSGDAVLAELVELWSKRLITLFPRPVR